MTARDFFLLADLHRELSADAANAAQRIVTAHGSAVARTILDRYAPLSPQDQRDVTLFVEVAASRGVEAAEEAMHDLHAYDAQHSNPRRDAEACPSRTFHRAA